MNSPQTDKMLFILYNLLSYKKTTNPNNYQNKKILLCIVLFFSTL